MMPDDRDLVRRIAWREVCPWLMIFRCFRLSISLPVLFLATVGMALTPIGYRIGQTLFDVPAEAEATDPLILPAVNWEGARADNSFPNNLSAIGNEALAGNVGGVYWCYVRPFKRLFDRGMSLSEISYHLMGGIWIIFVWAFFAGVITRIAAVQLGREERIGMNEAVQHARKQFGWYFVAPFFPLLGVVLTAIPIVAVGALMRVDGGLLVAGILWIPVLIGGLIISVFLLGLLFGWPLMWPAISAEEGGDAFEAFSRSYSYTFQRPLHYLFYVLVTLLFGILCWFLVAAFSTAVVEMSYWAASWGSGNARLEEVTDVPSGNTVKFAGAMLIKMSVLLVRMIAVSFNFSFFWCAATAIYLLLRRDVDQTEFDEVYLADEEERYGLPPLEDDEAGVPGVSVANSDAAEGDSPDSTPDSESEQTNRSASENDTE